ncbi:hypothetical protein B9G69_009515 [Bdellovibrio sp. SKB1291214]|uniref:hypothetical protein n=1 Tax=Bdellovibrio sp. SKB1291214 TaxID=1732569 RepID=UPI00113083DB|nr:hypothetical protein [Bdellovibrio sp. SKB1291214]UYL07283.1 hypothetical protein B9G69_009515 [Bdellovibrio sp. SKB1291214]
MGFFLLTVNAFILGFSSFSFAQNVEEIRSSTENARLSELLPEQISDSAAATVARFTTLQITDGNHIEHREDRVGVAYVSNKLIQIMGVDYSKLWGDSTWLKYRGSRVMGFSDLRPHQNILLTTILGTGQLQLEEFQHKVYLTERVLPLWKFKVDYTLSFHTHLRAEYNNDFSFMGWLDQGDQSQIMELKSLFLEIDTFEFANWQFRLNARQVHFADSNSQRIYDGLILREIHSVPFILKLGVGGNTMGFHQRLKGYWCPEQFATYGLRMIAQKDFLTHWNLETRLSHGFHQEKDHPPGKETTTELYLRYRTPSRWFFSINANILDVESGAWWKNDLSMNLEIPI